MCIRDRKKTSDGEEASEEESCGKEACGHVSLPDASSASLLFFKSKMSCAMRQLHGDTQDRIDDPA
eukprot:2919836-Prorocentrum_lima.AAC.1